MNAKPIAAFPSSSQWTNDGDRYEHAPDGRSVAPGGTVLLSDPGMSLRDYFAAKVMQALLSRDAPVSIDPHLFARESDVAYAAADAMLKARQT